MLLLLIISVLSVTNADFKTIEDFNADQSKTKALVFLSDICPCSKSHISHLNQLQERFKDTKIYGVISDPPQTPERKKMSDSYFNSDAFKFPIIDDPKQMLVKKYNALKTPHATLFKKNNNNEFEVIFEGGVTNKRDFEKSDIKFLEENLAELAQNKPVKYKNGMCLGCYIRRI